ncbi:hypothetical protein, partial [Segatella hominis]|uniref:hypothetical protein n=2 Tax=Segatella hominis TaxID=2518605 RepID=UPI003AB9A162
ICFFHGNLVSLQKSNILNRVNMAQILVTIDDTQSLASVRNAIKMLRGVVSTSVMDTSSLSKTEKQQAYVQKTLTKAMQEVKLAKLEGKELQNIDDFINEMREG